MAVEKRVWDPIRGKWVRDWERGVLSNPTPPQKMQMASNQRMYPTLAKPASMPEAGAIMRHERPSSGITPARPRTGITPAAPKIVHHGDAKIMKEAIDRYGKRGGYGAIGDAYGRGDAARTAARREAAQRFIYDSMHKNPAAQYVRQPTSPLRQFGNYAKNWGGKLVKGPWGKMIPFVGGAATGYALNEMMDWGEINDMRTAQKDPDRVNYLDRISSWWDFKNRQPGPPTTLHHDDSTVESFGDIWRSY